MRPSFLELSSRLGLDNTNKALHEAVTSVYATGAVYNYIQERNYDDDTAEGKKNQGNDGGDTDNEDNITEGKDINEDTNTNNPAPHRKLLVGYCLALFSLIGSAWFDLPLVGSISFSSTRII